MRNYLLILMLLIPFMGVSQLYTDAYRIEVTVNKTTNLIFPTAILSVDRGSDQVIVQKAADNILKVKATADSIAETNLTVVTADGKLYSFIVNYQLLPEHLTVYLGDKATVKVESRFKPLCEKIVKEKGNVVGQQYSSGKMTLKLIGFYIKDKTLYCKIKCDNRSQIGYDIEQFRLYIRDNTVAKRTASQETILEPLFVSGDTASIKGRSARIWVVALEKFTIPDDKHFEIEILEKNGGRHLFIKSYNRQVMLAKEF